MTVTVSTASSNNMADSLNSDIGTSHELNFYDVTDVLLATCTYSAASGVVSTSAGAEVITWSEANYTDDLTPGNAGTISYATIETSASLEVIRFSDPTNEIGLTSTSVLTTEPVRVTADIVFKMPNSTA